LGKKGRGADAEESRPGMSKHRKGFVAQVDPKDTGGCPPGDAFSSGGDGEEAA